MNGAPSPKQFCRRRMTRTGLFNGSSSSLITAPGKVTPFSNGLQRRPISIKCDGFSPGVAAKRGLRLVA